MIGLCDEEEVKIGIADRHLVHQDEPEGVNMLHVVFFPLGLV
jgi:hypothetical protein